MEEIKVRYNSRRLIERLGKKPKGENTYKKMKRLQDPEEKPDKVMVLIILAAIMVTMLIALW